MITDPLYLNRQAITLLSGLGVKDEALLDLQDTMLTKLRGILFDENEAAKSLTSHEFKRGEFKFGKLIGIGMHFTMFTKEPCFRGLLLGVFQHSISKYIEQRTSKRTE